ncbi:MAG TPA: hypothetical protein VIX12_01920 [Candidatus Binataceae bacterium]
MAELKELLEVAPVFGRYGRPWFFAGGWAIDLHLGRITRAHNDIDVLVMRRDQPRLSEHLAAFDLRKIIPHPEGLMNRGTVEPWREGELLELPVHQVDVHARGSNAKVFQVMMAESSDGDWVFRRNPAIRRPLVSIGFHPLWGLPYVAPEIVLLFKAKLMQPYDIADFKSVLPRLSVKARAWLRNALAIAHPGHEWIVQL